MDITDLEDIIPEEISGACGLAAPFVAYGLIAVSILIHPWFTWADNALSDLGAVGEPYNFVFNLGLIAAGILGVIFVLGTIQFVEEIIGQIGIIVLIACMVCLILIGVFPSGTSPHYWVSILFFGLSAIGLIAMGIDQMWDLTEPVWGTFILSTVVLAASTVWLVYSIPYEIGAAIPEFIGSIPIMEFSLVYGARMFLE